MILRQKNFCWVALLFFSLGFALYWPSLFGDFLGDDYGRIVLQEKLYKQDLAAAFSIMPDRPLLFLTTWLNYQIGGMNPFGFKLINILLHILNSLFIFLIAKKAFSLDPKRLNLFALIAGLLFLIHPLNTQAINIVIQRGALLSTGFVLLSFLSFLSFIESKNSRTLLISALLFSLSLLSKTNTPTFLLILFIYLKFYKNMSFKESFSSLRAHLISLGLTTAYIVSTANFDPQFTELNSWQYFSTQTHVIWLYLKLFLIPVPLQYLYEQNLEPLKHYPVAQMILPLIAHLTLIAVAFRALRTKNKARPIWAVSCIFMYLAFLPESGFLVIQHIIFEHRAYYPMAFGIFIPALVLSSDRIQRHLRTVMIMTFCLFLGATTYSRNQDSKLYVSWAKTFIRQNPHDIGHNTSLLNAMFRLYRSEKGLEISKELQRLKPHRKEYYIYSQIFSFEHTPSEKVSKLENIAKAMLKEPDIYPKAREDGIIFIAEQLKKSTDDLEYIKKMDALVYPQILFVAANRTMFRETIKSFFTNLVRLRNHYEQNPPKNDEDLYRQFRVFMCLDLFFDGPSIDIQKDLEKFLNSKSANPRIVELKQVYRENKGNKLTQLIVF